MLHGFYLPFLCWPLIQQFNWMPVFFSLMFEESIAMKGSLKADILTSMRPYSISSVPLMVGNCAFFCYHCLNCQCDQYLVLNLYHFTLIGLELFCRLAGLKQTCFVLLLAFYGVHNFFLHLNFSGCCQVQRWTDDFGSALPPQMF